MQPPEAGPDSGPTVSSGPPVGRGHVIVVAGGDVPPRDVLDRTWPGWAADTAQVIAADSGWSRARALGLEPVVLVGDLDSLDPAMLAAAEAGSVQVLRVRVDKDESDTELALLEAVRRGAGAITVLGALGGPRFDHALANIWLLAHPALAGIDVVLLDAGVRVSLVAAPDPDGHPVTRALPGPTGALVSLFPLGGDAEGVTSRGLRYPLADEPLRTGPARGLSNLRSEAGAAITVRRGRVLIVEAAVADGPARVSSGA